MNPTDLKHQKELNVFRTIPWQEVCKFLAGGFFVNAGILFYLYVARVSVPLWGTGFIETPEVSGVRSNRARVRSYKDRRYVHFRVT